MVLVVEHKSSRSGRWLRRNRFRLALWVAVAEAALVLFGVLPGWPAFFVALALIAFHLVAGRRVAYDTAREASWIAAMSQLLIALLPLVAAAIAVTAAVLVTILVLAGLGILVLLLARR